MPLEFVGYLSLKMNCHNLGANVFSRIRLFPKAKALSKGVYRKMYHTYLSIEISRLRSRSPKE